jgi:CBS domain containing-hemolysin-like protein
MLNKLLLAIPEKIRYIHDTLHIYFLGDDFLDTTVALQVFILLLLILLSAFFSSAETALTTANRIKMKGMAEEGDRQAQTVLDVTEDSGKMLSTILIGNNIVNISASSLVTTLALKLWGNAAVAAASGLLTLVVLIFGEITPKTLATLHADKMARMYSGVILFLMKILTPVIFLINTLANLVLRLMGVDPDAKSPSMTEHELRTIVDVSHEDGVIESEERQMIYNVFDFGDSRAKDIMVPRVDMVFLNITSNYETVSSVVRREKFTRFPVYEGTKDNIIGLLNIKDLLVQDPTNSFDLRRILREPYFTYEYKKTSELMMEMRKDSINFTIVLDEYGAVAGLITLEDLLEEIVGEIRDEYDKDEEELIKQISDLEYVVEGSLKLDDLNDALDLSLHSKDYDSVGGYIIERLDHLPQAGEFIVDEQQIRMVVDIVHKNRIDKVHIYLPEQAEVSSQEDAEEL